MKAAVLKLLLTGDPGCGKTTVLRRVVERLQETVPMSGFLTEERLEEGRRVAFWVRTLDGRSFALADRAFADGPRVGPYGVDVRGLETIGLEALSVDARTRLVVLDEIGKMESLSAAFRERVEELLAAPVPLLGTVAQHGVGFVKRVRQDPRVTLVRMRRRGREAMVGDLLRRLAAIGIRPLPGDPKAD